MDSFTGHRAGREFVPGTSGGIVLSSSWGVSQGSLESVCVFHSGEQAEVQQLLTRHVHGDDQREDLQSSTRQEYPADQSEQGGVCVLRKDEAVEGACAVTIIFSGGTPCAKRLSVTSSAKFLEVYSLDHQDVGPTLEEGGGGEYLGTVRCAPITVSCSHILPNANGEGPARPLHSSSEHVAPATTLPSASAHISLESSQEHSPSGTTPKLPPSEQNGETMAISQKGGLKSTSLGDGIATTSHLDRVMNGYLRDNTALATEASSSGASQSQPRSSKSQGSSSGGPGPSPTTSGSSCERDVARQREGTSKVGGMGQVVEANQVKAMGQVKWMRGSLDLESVRGLRLKFLGLPAPKTLLHLLQLSIEGDFPAASSSEPLQRHADALPALAPKTHQPSGVSSLSSGSLRQMPMPGPPGAPPTMAAMGMMASLLTPAQVQAPDATMAALVQAAVSGSGEMRTKNSEGQKRSESRGLQGIQLLAAMMQQAAGSSAGPPGQPVMAALDPRGGAPRGPGLLAGLLGAGLASPSTGMASGSSGCVEALRGNTVMASENTGRLEAPQSSSVMASQLAGCFLRGAEEMERAGLDSALASGLPHGAPPGSAHDAPNLQNGAPNGSLFGSLNGSPDGLHRSSTTEAATASPHAAKLVGTGCTGTDRDAPIMFQGSYTGSPRGCCDAPPPNGSKPLAHRGDGTVVLSPRGSTTAAGTGDGLISQVGFLRKMAEQDKKMLSAIDSFSKTTLGLQRQLNEMSQRVADLESKLSAANIVREERS